LRLKMIQVGEGSLAKKVSPLPPARPSDQAPNAPACLVVPLYFVGSSHRCAPSSDGAAHLSVQRGAPSEPLHCAAFSRQMVSAPTLDEVACLRGHTDRAWHVSWHPTLDILASCSGDRTVRLWAPGRGAPSATAWDAWGCVGTLEVGCLRPPPHCALRFPQRSPRAACPSALSYDIVEHAFMCARAVEGRVGQSWCLVLLRKENAAAHVATPLHHPPAHPHTQPHVCHPAPGCRGTSRHASTSTVCPCWSWWGVA
jgi:hypothetical protein